MATTLATIRADLLDALGSITTTNKYRRRQTDPKFPCHVIGWPETFDIRPDMGDERDAIIPVWIGVESTDDDSHDDLLSSLMEDTITALLDAGHDVQPVSNFGEQQLADDRIIVWCSVPVKVLA